MNKSFESGDYEQVDTQPKAKLMRTKGTQML